VRLALPGGPYLVVGLARSGVAALRALRARGEEALGVDAGTPAVDLPGVALGTDGVALLDGVRTVVKSPGVPQAAPVVAAARAQGLTVMGELELAWRLLENPFVAVTGTNGKTTTVELLGHVHREAGVPVAVAGNVGTALTGLDVGPETVVVAETSSFQLEDTLAFAPDAAALLNITPDHLDRHGTFAAYREAKLRAFAHQGPEHVAVLPHGTEAPGRARRVVLDEDVAVRDGVVLWRGEPLLRADEVRLRGPHNLRNAMAAAALALARGLEPDAVRAGLRTFAGVPHRLEEVARHDGVVFVNDSKATNVDSTLTALRAFPSGVHLILGGRGKEQDFSPLRGPVAERCASVHLIGEDAERIGAEVGTGDDDGDLERAVAHARALAAPGEVVLLSPACASFDQFADFEARGDAFRRIVG
jgi:UDP-N-acetylmuramoylalanine--D-glutamate ligase